MNPSIQDWQGVTHLLEKLERENRRLKGLGLAALLGVVTLLLMGQAASNKTVEANAFILKDGNGKERASLDVFEDAPRLRLLDAAGEPRVMLLGLANGPGIFVFDTAGRIRASLAIDQDGPFLSLLDAAGKERAGFLLAKGGHPELRLTDSNQKEEVKIGELVGGGPALQLFGPNGTAEAALAISSDSPGLVLTDESGKPSASLIVPPGRPVLSLSDYEGFEATIGVKDLITPRTGETHQTSAASVVLFDKDKNVLWQAP